MLTLFQICGHSKCKYCLIEEEDECRQCSAQVEVVDDHNYSNEQSVVLGFEVVQIETEQGGKYEILSEECQEDKDQYIEEEYLETQSEVEFTKETHATDLIKQEPEVTIVDETLKKGGVVVRKARANQKPNFIELITVTNETSGESEQRYRCNLCQKTFKSSHQIRYHQYCDDSLEKPYKCDECSVKYRTSYQLKQHQQLHLNTVYECPECSRKFSHDASAKKHYKKHFQTAPPPKKPTPKGVFPCQLCEKIFSRNDYLKKHMICHEEKKRFKCDHCDRIYARNNALKFHIITAHTERQEFECHCGKTFSTMQSLTRHQIVHSASKPLKCLICGLRSSRKDNLFRHIRTFHTESDPKTCIGIEENAEPDETEPMEEDVQMEETTTTVIRSQEASLRKNVIVMQKQLVKKEQPSQQNEYKTIVFRVEKQTNGEILSSSTSSNKDPLTPPPSSVQNLKNIDIYRKILLPMTEDAPPAEESPADDEIHEYIEHLS